MTDERPIDVSSRINGKDSSLNGLVWSRSLTRELLELLLSLYSRSRRE